MSTMTILRAVLPALLLVVLATSEAEAVPCPGTGAKLRVVINNPTTTTGQKVFISGSIVDGQATCVGQSDTYATTVTLSSTGNNTFDIPVSGGLNTGVWIHHISVGEQFQHRRSPVLFATNSADYARVNWTYYPDVIQVNKFGDATGSCSSGVCTFRQAVEAANGLVSIGRPAVLIQLMLTPGTMAQTADIEVGIPSAPGIIEIDGTDANGNPWIVGDALAAAQGSQSPFSRALDLKRLTRIVLEGDDVTLRGLSIANTGTTTLQTEALVEVLSGEIARIEAVRIDGGASGTCGTCIDDGSDLLYLGGAASQIANVEARGALSNGVRVLPGFFQEIRDSWFHHNWGSAVKGNGVELLRNMLELSGRRLSNNAVTTSAAVGVRGDAGAQIYSMDNVIRNHTRHGIDTPMVLELNFINDYVCGNGGSGIVLRGTSSSDVAFGTGLGTTYNGGGSVENGTGVRFLEDFDTDTLVFDNNSAFTANEGCGFLNESTTQVSAENNQWRGVTDPSTEVCEDSDDFCTSAGPVDCNPIQNPGNVPIVLNASEPSFPRNAFIKGQTLRVRGSGFNAITGNPVAGTGEGEYDCALGSGDVSSSNCCRSNSKANVCGAGNPPTPPSDGSNCVAVFDVTTSWRPLSVTSVTPTTIVTEVPDPGFLCVGEGYTQTVRVVKQGSITPILDFEPYCRNTP